MDQNYDYAEVIDSNQTGERYTLVSRQVDSEQKYFYSQGNQI